MLIKFRAGTPAAERGALRAEIGAAFRVRFRSGGEHWRLPPGVSTEEAVARLRSRPQVEHVEPNYVVAASRLPDDPLYPRQHHLKNTGQVGGTEGADIDAVRAWNLSIGSREVIVAILDTGVDAAHPDLAANRFVNAGEVPANGVDDDGNGFIDDTGGWDFAHEDNDPSDDNGHGTHVAGIAGAVGNNGRGVSGVSWNVSILPIKFLAADGTGFSSDAIRAIDYAALMGAHVMNASWGGGGLSRIMEEAIGAAGGADILFVAAAGNDASNLDVVPHYPASYALPNVVAVAATGADDQLATFSNYGASSVLLGAPGVTVLSTLPGSRYGYLSGTSMAAPVVAGAAALLRAVEPGLSVAEVRRRLRDAADPVAALAARTISGGRINAFRMMAEEDTTPPGAIDDLRVEEVSSSSATLRWTATGDDGGAGRASSYEVQVTGDFIVPLEAGSTVVFPNRSVPGPAGAEETLEVTGLDHASTYSFRVRALDEWEQPGPFSNSVEATTLGPPVLASSPAAIEAALRTGQTVAAAILVENVGSGTLDWRVRGAAGVPVNPDDPFVLPAWLSVVPPLGRVAAGGGQEVSLTIDAAGLSGGLYETSVELITNDPDRRNAPHPVRLVVTDAPAIEVQPRRIDFGTVLAGTSVLRSIVVRNTGTVDLAVGGVVAGDAALSVDPQGFLLPPGSGRVLEVAWTPALPSVLASGVVVLSDAANESAAEVAIEGTALPPPSIDVAPPAIDLSLPAGGGATAHLRLANGGGSDLVAALEAGAAAGPPWLHASPENVVVPSGGAVDVALRIETAGLPAAVHEGEVRVTSNVPGSPGLRVPVRLSVEDAPHLAIEVPEVVLESRRDFTYDGETTRHDLASPLRPAGGGTIDLLVVGDFGNPTEKATLLVEGREIGTASGAAGQCGSLARRFEISPEEMSAFLADGVFEAEVRNTAAVGPSCDENRHTVRLRYGADAAGVDFGTLMTGTARTRSIVLRNTGTLDLRLGSVEADLPGLTLGESPALLDPGAEATLRLSLEAPPEGPTGVLEGTLSVDSDDPTSGRRSVALTADVIAPPGFTVVPDRIEATLLEGRREAFPLALSNPGSEPIDLALSIGGGTTGAVPDPCPPATFFVAGFNAGTLEAIDAAGGAPRTIATGFFGPGAVALDPAGRTAYVTEFNGRLAAVDLASGTVRRLAPGVGTSFGIFFDAGGRALYASSFTSGALLRVDPASGATLRIASGLMGPRAIALDAAGTTAWVVESTRGALSRVDLQTGAVALVAEGLPQASGLAVDRQGTRAYVSLIDSGSLVAVDLATGATSGVAGGLSQPSHLVLDESEAALYVAEQGGDRIAVVDPRTRDVRTLAGGLADPSGLALSSPSACHSRFASVEPRSQRIPAGGTAAVTVSVDATGLPEGEFGTLLSIGPLRPFIPSTGIPVRLTAVPRPRLRLSGQEVVLESVLTYTTAGARTRHVLHPAVRPGTAGTLTVTLEGDYGTAQEKGTVRFEGSTLGVIGGAGADCVAISGTFEIGAALLAAAVADNSVEVEVLNSSLVAATCPVNRHLVRLSYRTTNLVPGIDFEDIDVGQERVIPLTVLNPGGRTLEVTGIAASGPGFSASPEGMSLAPGASLPLLVGFSAAAPGAAAGLLRLSSNDPDAPSIEVPLAAVGVPPPRLEWDPAALEGTVTEGRRLSRGLTLFNRGGRALSVTMSAQPPGDATITPAFGSVPPGAALATTVGFNSDLFPPGPRSLEIVIASNDPARREARVPAAVLVRADADRDGVPDDRDLCPTVRDEDQSDGDGDGAGDACDNCPDQPNATQDDADGDGSGDACQPSIILAGVRQDGGERLEVAARVFDPQRDPIRGTIDLIPEEPGLPFLTLPWNGALPRLSDISVLAPGRPYRLVLTVTDDSTLPVSRQAAFLHQEERILVLDMPPRPVAALPPVVECDRPLAGGVRLDGSGSQDEDSTPGTADDIVSYEWLRVDAEGSRHPLGSGSILETALPLGESRVVLRVTDAAGEAAEGGAPVLVRDTAPPALALTVLPEILWPPDHRLAPVRLIGEAADVCDPAPSIGFVAATSSEDDDAPGAGDGRTTGDVGEARLSGGEGEVLLRAERDGAGPGRIYTLTCEARDRAGNGARAAATVRVPRGSEIGP